MNVTMGAPQSGHSNFRGIPNPPFFKERGAIASDDGL
jgi:hypothetical protein